MIEDPDNAAELKRHSPFGLFPLLIDDGKPVLETSIIIEHLQLHHPGPTTWIPDGDEGLRVRFLDRFFDLHVMNNMNVPVASKIRPEGTQDDYGVARAREKLHVAYDWLDANLGEGPWAVGEHFTLADVESDGVIWIPHRPQPPDFKTAIARCRCRTGASTLFNNACRWTGRSAT